MVIPLSPLQQYGTSDSISHDKVLDFVCSTYVHEAGPLAICAAGTFFIPYGTIDKIYLFKSDK